MGHGVTAAASVKQLILLITVGLLSGRCAELVVAAWRHWCGLDCMFRFRSLKHAAVSLADAPGRAKETSAVIY